MSDQRVHDAALQPLLMRQEAERLRRYLADESGCRVALVVTRNRSSMISIRFLTEHHVRVRLHHAFLHAPPEVLAALVRYLRNRSRYAWQTVGQFAREIPVEMRPPQTPVKRRLQQQGRFHDLTRLSSQVNDTYFGGALVFDVTWGNRAHAGRGRSIRYGTCDCASRCIRINARLDDPRVPDWFVCYILYHEMLHLVIPPYRQGRRRIDHPPEFHAREKQFAQYAQCQEMSRQLLRVLSRPYAAG